MWTPNVQNFTTFIKIQSRVETDINGQPEITYSDKVECLCNWKGRGGSESLKSSSMVVEDTAEIVMWFIPGINERDLVLLNHVIAFEVLNVENVEMRNQYLQIKVRRVVNT